MEPDNYWFGSKLDRLVDLRGERVDALIGRGEAAVAAYPYPAMYRTWPGPNSNTFTAVFSDRVDTRLVPPAHGDASGVRGAAWLWEPGEAPCVASCCSGPATSPSAS